LFLRVTQEISEYHIDLKSKRLFDFD